VPLARSRALPTDDELGVVVVVDGANKLFCVSGHADLAAWVACSSSHELGAALVVEPLVGFGEKASRPATVSALFQSGP
jgi:hypothetical protein